MKLFSASQIRRWDEYTIRHEPIAPFDLMERAATACVDWILQKHWKELPFAVCCGKGNNGGDGLAIAHLLLQKGHYVEVYILETSKPGTAAFEHNLKRLYEVTEDINFLTAATSFPFIKRNAIIIDALFGTGLTKPLDGTASALVQHLNATGALAVSIDLPGGLLADEASTGDAVVADYTLTFQIPKLALLVQDNGRFVGEMVVLNIGLHPDFAESEESSYELVDPHLAKALYKPRSRFSHKGSFGHALLAAGSWGKMGAAVLAAKACLRSGAGLLTTYIPACGYGIMQTTVPEAMALTDNDAMQLSSLPDDIEKWSAVGVGPGIGTALPTQEFVAHLVAACTKPMVLDADALNCIALRKDLLHSLPAGSILTPHPKEFDRMFGEHTSDFDRIETARQQAAIHNIIILLKGHYTLIVTPAGRCYFNSTGNAGMAKGGSGDVLTGILTSFLTQGYAPIAAAVLGVYLHGLAGDLCAASLGMESMLPGDIILFLGKAFLEARE
jgi:NAD(P)H-hydrate epimerase